jgi:hypothetical protein
MDTIGQGEKRQAFMDGLIEKGSTAVLTNQEAFLVLQGTLAEMLTESIKELTSDVEKMPEGFEKINARTFVEMARSLRNEALRVIDGAMKANTPIVVL